MMELYNSYKGVEVPQALKMSEDEALEALIVKCAISLNLIKEYKELE